MNGSGNIMLTYRQLGERLNTKTDAARMRAKRAAGQGVWRIIPGNHPNDPVMVELPESVAVAEHRSLSRSPEPLPRPSPELPEQSPALPEQSEDTGTAVAALASALKRAEAQLAEANRQRIVDSGTIGAPDAHLMSAEGTAARRADELDEVRALLADALALTPAPTREGGRG